MKKIVLFLFLVVLAFVSVITTFAAPPETETFEFDYVYPLVDCGLEGVGEFWIYNNETGSGSLKTFYDNDGNLIKEKGHVNGTDSLFVPGYPDNVVAGAFAINWTTAVDPDTGEYTLSHEPGNWWHITLPGSGNNIHFAGLENLQYDPDEDEWITIKENGLRYFDLVPLCEYLAP